MECNKDEAMRAKDIAMRKFTERDFGGAKKFAVKAQTLYPGLENISQMLTTLEVYISAENKVNGEMDMYGILGVNPMADDETIKKHYRKLALVLHPDKNKSIGADGAFHLLSEAFNFLSDKAKRSTYNSRLNIRTTQFPSRSSVSVGPTNGRHFQQKFPTQSGVRVERTFSSPGGSNSNASRQKPGPTQSEKSAIPPSRSGVSAGPANGRHFQQKFPTQNGVRVERTFNTPGGSNSNASRQKPGPTQSEKSAVPPVVNGYHKHPNGKLHRAISRTRGVFKSAGSFWTMCTSCKMQYEYIKVYLNRILKCPNCQVGFVAAEITPPSKLSPVRLQQQHKKPSSSSGGPHISESNNNASVGTSARWSQMSGTTAYNQAKSVSQLVNDRVKREREETHKGSRWERNNDSGFVFGGEGPLKKKKGNG